MIALEFHGFDFDPRHQTHGTTSRHTNTAMPLTEWDGTRQTTWFLLIYSQITNSMQKLCISRFQEIPHSIRTHDSYKWGVNHLIASNRMWSNGIQFNWRMKSENWLQWNCFVFVLFCVVGVVLNFHILIFIQPFCSFHFAVLYS